MDELFPKPDWGNIENPFPPKPTPEELGEEIVERRWLLSKLPAPGMFGLPENYDPTEHNRLQSELSQLEMEYERITKLEPYAEHALKLDAESKLRGMNFKKKMNTSGRHKQLLKAAKERRAKMPYRTINAVADYLIVEGKTELKKRRVIDIIKHLWEEE